MLTYKYEARNAATGEVLKSVIQAENEQAAARLIKQQGLVPLEVALETSGGFNPFSKFTNKVRIKDKILMTRQLSTLINAGLPLLQSLRSVTAQSQSKQLKVVMNRVINDVEGGAALSAALAKHPEVFNNIFIAMVGAGEVSGTLDKSFERLANQQEKDAEIMSKVRGAMVYPIIVLAVMGLVVGFMIVKVLPQVETLYDDLPGQRLPLITRLLLMVSHGIIDFWWVFLILAIIGGVFTSRWIRTIGGKRVLDKLKMRAWPVGPLFMKMYMARFSRTGSTLVASGVPLLQMMSITANSVNNVHIEDSIRVASDKVKGGKALSDSLKGDPNFLQLVPDMLKIGEQSGSLEQMLEKIADYYEKEVDNQIKTISTIIEPVLMVLLGVFAFIIVAAVLLPIYSLAGKSLIR